MKIYKLREQSNLRSITIFHAMARLGYEGLVTVYPSETYISVGYFDKTQSILDVEKCKQHCIPIIRREVGGGPVLLDSNQVFYHLIMKREGRKLPFKIEEAYQRYSQPVINTYKRLGIDVYYRPINDIAVKDSHKKISGQGAADIGDSFVFVGSILLKFDTKLMSQLFRVPEEKFRDKLYKTLEDNISWVEKETGKLPDREEVTNILVEEFSKIIDFEGEGTIGDDVIELADKLKEEFTSDKVLFEDTGREHRAIKIREGLYVRNGVHKAKGGLVKSEVYVWENIIENVRIFGDFTLYPKESILDLEEHLIGIPFEKEAVTKKVNDFFEKDSLDFPGVTTEDIVKSVYGE